MLNILVIVKKKLTFTRSWDRNLWRDWSNRWWNRSFIYKKTVRFHACKGII
jgi:hypothetical protein